MAQKNHDCDGGTESSTGGESDVRVLAVVGPTAAGKTALAEELAVRLGGEIVSADSMQVYRGMDVGTAKPPLRERRVPYWCLDIADPDTPFSAARYQREAREAISDIAARGLTPIVCGGTGLYVRAALDDMRFPPPGPAATSAREHYEDVARTDGADALHGLLAERDAASATLLHANNTRRIVRALEMLDTGVSYAEQQSGFVRRESIYDAHFVGLTIDRALLYERIDARVDEMMAGGLLDEVRLLLAAGVDVTSTAMQAIGYRQLVPVIAGLVTLDDAVDAVKTASRRYAKRQLTWFRADPRVNWIDATRLSGAEAADLALRTLDL